MTKTIHELTADALNGKGSKKAVEAAERMKQALADAGGGSITHGGKTIVIEKSSKEPSHEQ